VRAAGRAGGRGRSRPIVVDASIAVQWFANEPGSEAAARLIDDDTPLVAPDVMPVEAANAWWKKVRRREMTGADLDQAVANLLALGIRLVPTAPLLGRAARLAVQLDHPVYDCVYLALSGDGRGALATADEDLRRMAAHLAIPVWRP
jgi:predicted nucleic acid-binding protein